MIATVTAAAPMPTVTGRPFGPAALTPVQKVAESFIGQRVGKADFNDLGSYDFRVTGMFGAKQGYESLDEAVKLARTTARESFVVDPTKPGRAKALDAFLVFRAGSRYALMQADHPLLLSGSRNTWRAEGYRTWDSPATSALAAVIDGAGNLVPNLGSAHWWK